MSDAERLAQVAAILGLLPASNQTWESRARFWAYLIADGSGDEHIAEARARVEDVRPGWTEHALSFAEEKASVGAVEEGENDA